MSECPEIGDLVAVEMPRVATQYREATKFLGYLRAVLSGIEEAALATCAIPSKFDIETAIGDQLTLIGKRIGFPRCHCVCDLPPVFGFLADGYTPTRPIAGLCDDGSTWAGCEETGVGDLCINDDERFRAFLMVRRYQMLGLYDPDSLETCIRLFWGSQSRAISKGDGSVVLVPARNLSTVEMQYFLIVLRVLPIAPGIRADVHFGDEPVFGFGTGWAGLCEDAVWLCPTRFDPYACN